MHHKQPEVFFTKNQPIYLTKIIERIDFIPERFRLCLARQPQ